MAKSPTKSSSASAASEPEPAPPEPAEAAPAAGRRLRLLDFLRLPSPRVIAGVLSSLLFLTVLVLIINASGPWFRALYWSLDPPIGYVYVDSPEVYTRERLINERLNEEAWLNQQLAGVDENLDFTVYENIVRSDVTLAARTDGNDAGDAAGDGAGQSADADDSAIIGFDQKFRLKSATRSLIRQRIIENKLDDRHDLEGNALYILKFDNTLIDAPVVDRMAAVSMEVLPPLAIQNLISEARAGAKRPELSRSMRERSGARLNEIYFEWISSIAARINAIAAAQYGAFLNNRIDANGRARLVAFIGAEADLQAGDELATIAAADRPYMHLWNEIRGQFPAMDTTLFVKRLKAYFIERAVSQVLGVAEELITFNLDQQFSTQREFAVSIEDLDKKVRVSAIIDLDQFAKPRVAVHPRSWFGFIVGGDCEVVETSNMFSFGELELEDRSLRIYSATPDTPIDIEAVSDITRQMVLDYQGEQRVRDAGWQLTDLGAIGFFGNETIRVNQGCGEFYSFNIRVGYYDFVSRILSFNTYSYSVLPRESTIPVINDIRNRRDYSAGHGGSLLGGVFEDTSRSVELRPALTTFGDVVARDTTEVSSPAPVVGWVLDPAARAPRARETGDYVTMNESVLAIISVPAWWREIRLVIRKRWITSDGSTMEVETVFQEMADVPNVSDVPDAAGPSRARGLPVRLPSRPELIDSLLIENAQTRGPLIVGIDHGDATSCEDFPLLVIGQRLWRNTAVTVGSVKAARIEVMPDMGGVIAYFRQPFRAESGDSLRIWTSEGVAAIDLPQAIPSADLAACEASAATGARSRG